jgi:hypothetical protein
MAMHESAHSPEHCNTLTRRAALYGAAGCSALATLPVAVLADTSANLPLYTDPLIAMWAERQKAKAAADAGEDGPDEDELVDRLAGIEDVILRTVPVSPEGAAIVATVLLENWDEQDAVAQRAYGSPAYRDPEKAGGDSLAQHILANTPADVLRRAGLEG